MLIATLAEEVGNNQALTRFFPTDVMARVGIIRLETCNVLRAAVREKSCFFAGRAKAAARNW
jgi:hypothetical protein